MSFWTDADFITVDELVALDPEVPSIATNMSLTMEGPSGIIRHGIDESGIEIMGWLQSAVANWTVGGVPPWHMAAVLGAWGNRVRAHLAQIVIETGYGGDWSAVKRWVAYKTLYQVYTTAADRATIDRYQAKAERCLRRLQYSLEPILWNNGLGACQVPLACPTTRIPNAGFWDARDITFVSDPASLELGYCCDFAITYTGPGWHTPAQDRTCESAPSARAQVTVPAQSTPVISIARLNPPTAQNIDTRQYGMYTPMFPSGWRVWAGEPGATLFLQTPQPLPLSQKTYSFTVRPVFGGQAASTGQSPEGTITLQRVHFIG